MPPPEYHIKQCRDFIVGEGPDGLSLTVERRGGDGPRVFMRNGIVGIGSPGVERVRWLVGELDAVRVYISQNADGSTDIVLTKRDVYPGGTDVGGE